MMVHACNPMYLGGCDHCLRPAQAKDSWDSISTKSWVWWHTPVIPAMQEAKIGKIMVQANLCKKVRPYLQNN
jgi:hypothetical protein